MKEKIAIILVSPAGQGLADKLKKQYPSAEIYTRRTIGGTVGETAPRTPGGTALRTVGETAGQATGETSPGAPGETTLPPPTTVESFEALTGRLFAEVGAFVFIGALGICVRSIAPFLADKHTDPAVVCIDSTGRFVIPVVSGHIGGANELSRELAALLGAQAIVTTQSDNTNLWALDTFERLYGWKTIAEVPGAAGEATGAGSASGAGETTEMGETNRAGKVTGVGEAAGKPMNACITAFVNRRPTALLLDIRDKGTEQLERTCPEHVKLFYRFEEIDPKAYELVLIVSPRTYPPMPVPTLRFIPKVLQLGAGCRKDMKGDATLFYRHVATALTAAGWAPEALAGLHSIDLKKCEPVLNLLAYGAMEGSFHTYPATELDAIVVPNPSERVKEATASASVAEAAAIRGAGGGPLVIEKQKGDLGPGNEYTFAVAMNRAACRGGHIEIVGAGPGDPDLISIRGRYLLEKADLILYAGSLVPKELTACAKPGATVRSSADMNLEEQFALMKSFYDQGKFVVRLHTGDPCIYGAIQEQMNYFDQYGLNYHITPGISSFQAAAAALGSQFTIPEKVQTIILTRGEGRTPMPEKEQLHKLAASQSTMCIFLSAGIVEQVQEELLQAYPPSTPVAACYKLTWKDERIYRGELRNLSKIVRENHLTLTTLLVVGEAIGNRQGLSRLYAEEFKHLFRP